MKKLVINLDRLKFLRCTTDEVAGKIFKALYTYVLEGTEVIDKQILPLLVGLYDEIEKNKSIANKRAIAGSKKKGVEKEVAPSKKENDGRNIPPTLEQVKEYVFLKSINIDVELMWNYYNSVDWKVGKKKAKNWHSLVATWAKRSQKKENIAIGVKQSALSIFNSVYNGKENETTTTTDAECEIIS